MQHEKVFTTTHGRTATDLMLHSVAWTLRNVLRRTDFLGRWTGDRFLVILGGSSTKLFRAVERIQKLAGRSQIRWWGDQLSVSVLFGAAWAQADDTVESLVARAERSLHDAAAAKGGGTQQPNSI